MTDFETITPGVDIAHGDCLQLMPEIPDGAVDMVLCDLPYGVTGNSWDSVIDAEKLFAEYRRVLTPIGTILLFGSEPFSTTLRNAAMDLYKYDFVWVKNRPTGFPHAANKPLKNYELISVFSKGAMNHKSLIGDRRMTYNPQGLKRCDQYNHGHREKDGCYSVVHKNSMTKKSVYQEWTNYPRMAQEWPMGNKDSMHSTQKPVDLCAYMVRTYTNPGETVLDNTMGSGTTGVACINTDRKFIGIELDDGYYEIAKKRLMETAAQGKLFAYED